MTEKRYYADSYTTRFDARVVERVQHGGHPAVVLDGSYFYPSSGGQPHDTGRLNGVAVVDVLLRPADGAVLHVLEAPLAAATVTGEIDWPRRFDHMQHHTGQHILSQAFERVAGARTVGFHLSAESVTIDLHRDDLEPAQIGAAETLANEIVWENRPVTARQVSHDEAARLPLRKIPDVDDDQLRLVDIAGFDLTACGGTHVAATGAVGLIKIVRTGRQRRKLRVEFRCGARALSDYRTKNDIAHQLTSRLTVGHRELDDAVARLQQELKSSRRALKKEQAALLEVEAAALRQTGVTHPGLTLICRLVADADGERVRALAQRLARQEGVVALLASAGPPVHVVAARHQQAPGDMGELLRTILAALETAAGETPGGGGGERFAQGGGVTVPAGDVAAILAAAGRRLLGQVASGD